MKLTGEMLYQIYAKHAIQHNVEFWGWDEVKTGTRNFYDGIAEDLSTMLEKHQTQPLVAEQQYRTQVQIFSAVGPYRSAYERVSQDANEWIARHPGTVIINAAPAVFGCVEWTEYSLVLVVELPEQAEATT